MNGNNPYTPQAYWRQHSHGGGPGYIDYSKIRGNTAEWKWVGPVLKTLGGAGLGFVTGGPLGAVAGAAGGLAGSGVFGGGGGGQNAEAPDLSFYEGWGEYPTEAVTRGEQAIQQKTSDWLTNAMLGIRGTAAERGITNSSYATEMGDIAGKEAAGVMSGELADLYKWAAEQEYTGNLMGKQAYVQMLMNYQNALAQQGEDSWLSDAMSLIDFVGSFQKKS